MEARRNFLALRISLICVLGSPSAGALGEGSNMTPTTSNTVLDPSPFTTTRANGMGGALSTIAEDLDALYYNPAGIGGLGFENRPAKVPFIRALYFPYVGGSINENAIAVQKQLTASGAQSDAGAGAAVMKANEGKRQYARASFVPMGFLIGRTAIVPINDHQLAAVPVADGSGDVNMRYRTFTGFMVGSSIADSGNRFSLGVSQALGTIEETSGTFKYLDMVDVDKRRDILKENRKTYDAKPVNMGMTIRIPKSVTPTLSIVARNSGNTRNNAKDKSQKPMIFDEDLTAGFSISPELGRIGRFHLLVESGYLTQKHMAGSKKIRGGAEFLLGGETGQSLLGLRVGGNSAGASFGAHFNLGLIGIEAENHAVDVGVNNDRLIERRSTGVVYINVASF